MLALIRQQIHRAFKRQKYQKTNKALTSYVQSDYFKGKSDRMTELVDMEHATSIKMTEDAMKQSAQKLNQTEMCCS